MTTKPSDMKPSEPPFAVGDSVRVSRLHFSTAGKITGYDPANGKFFVSCKRNGGWFSANEISRP